VKILSIILFNIILLATFVSAETFNHKPDQSSKNIVKEKGTECTDTSPLCKNGYLNYVKHNSWDTPFNPHKILDNWIVVSSAIMPPGLPFVVMGNPIINWDKFPKDLDPALAILPNGVKYSAVFFTFAIVANKDKEPTTELIIIGYRELLVGGSVVLHTLNKDKSGYERIPEKKRKETLKYMETNGGLITCNIKIINSKKLFNHGV